VPPFSSTGGDLVDQLREWVDRQRERLAGRKNGADARVAARRPARRGGRTQAIPIGAARSAPGARPNRYGRQRVDRAARGTYTIILFAVLLVATIALGFAVNWALNSGSTAATPTPSPAPVGALPPPSPISSPPPAIVPSPSPSPGGLPGIQPPQQRFHVVEGGDTLNRIAQRYGVTVEAIMQANGFQDRNRILRIGERLVIPDAPTGSPVPR
jgi:LysM repeat protein